MKYRPEIDGLRALAVVPVVFFHAGLDLLQGGFIGVDIFLVISGYLIAYLILQEKAENKFSLAQFYERRARRILPALFVVILFSSVFAFLFLTPSQLSEYSLSIIAVLTFSSNLFFYLKTGYFSSAIDEKPLVHTWSLAVEEQFYILFPLLMLLSWRYLRKNLFGILVILTIISYLFAEVLSRTNADLSFYAMPTRAWELLAGALCALGVLKSREERSNELFSAVGLALILGSIILLHKHLPHPSFYTLPAVIGTCLILVFGTATMVARILSTPLIVWIGLVSYSAYLWHQPLLAAVRIMSLNEPSQIHLVTTALMSFGLAAISYRYVETPFRKKSRSGKYFISLKVLVWCLGICAFLLCSIGLIGYFFKGLPARFSIPESVTKTIERSTNAYACFDLPYPHESEKWGCDIGVEKEHDAYDFLVWGDSHLLVTYNAFLKAAESTRSKGFYVGIRQCVPLLGVHALRYDQQERNCYKLNKRVFNYVREKRIPKIILVARWSYYSTGGYDGRTFSYIGQTPDSKRSPEISMETFKKALVKTIEAYAEIGTEVIILEQVPQQKLHPEEIYFSAYRSKQPAQVIAKLSVSRKDNKLMQKAAMDEIYLVESRSSNLEVVGTTDVFCNKTCLVGTQEVSYYYDEDHLSISGSEILFPIVKKIMGDND